MTEILVNFIFGILPETIYFCLFMIYSKNLKEHRLRLFLLMLFEYFVVSCFIQYNVWLQITYTILLFIILKILYKEKALITDIFIFGASSLLLIAISALSYMAVYFTVNNYIIAYILNRILMFGTLFILKDKLHNWYLKFNGLWNRKPNQKIRSLTVRNVSVIIFNIMFYIINLGMLYFIAYLK